MTDPLAGDGRRRRVATIARKTRETDIRVELDLDGSGQYEVATGIAFFDHMLESFAKHALFDLRVKAEGDVHVDLHHTVEDVGIALGEARDTVTAKDPADRPGRHPQLWAQPVGATPMHPTSRQHPLLDFGWCPVRRPMRARRPVMQTGLAFGFVAGQPAVSTLAGHAHGLGHMRDG